MSSPAWAATSPARRTILVYWASQSEFNVPLGELPKELASVPNSVVAFICSTQAG